MIEFTRSRLDEIFSSYQNQKLIVVGDMMLDAYVWGRVNRISPEAPVPVVDVSEETVCLGGAANVCYNILSLGAGVIPIGVIGDDSRGEQLKTLFREKGFHADSLIADPSRMTTIKTRIMADGQHVVRMDTENKEAISTAIQDQVVAMVQSHLNDADGIIFEDYNKGLLVPETISRIIALANQHDKKVYVDPKFENFFEYINVTLFKPNKKEASDQLGYLLRSDQDIQRAGQELLDRLECDTVMITLGEGGLMLFEKGQPAAQVPTKAVRVHDVSGAGDTVIATLAVAMSTGASLRESASLANHAAGIVCGEVGIVPIEKQRLYEVMCEEMQIKSK